ncbi:MAG: hypothetical protein R3F20_14490 [Planctomycetota bacterium]
MEFSVGDVLSRSALVLKRRGPQFFGVGLIVMLPVLALMFVLREHFDVQRDFQPPPPGGPDATDRALDALLDLYTHMAIWNGSITLTEQLLTPILTAMVVFGSFRMLRGQDDRVRDAVDVVVRNLPRLIAVSIVYSLIVTIGTLLCCLPGIFAIIAMFVAVPAAVVERVGPVAAIRRSWTLVKPRFWPVVLVGLVLFAVIMGTGIVAGIFAQFAPTPVAIVVMWLARAVGLVFSSVASSVVYHDLRASSEGLLDEDYDAIFG